MEDDEAVRKLVELIFTKKFISTSEIPPDSYLPASLQTNDFWWRIHYVLFMRQVNIKYRWENPFNSSRYTMLSSHETYLGFVMTSCLVEHACNPTIFESFISVCCLVEYCNSETLENAGVSFCDLNSDIFMEFYNNVLKISFRKQGGFRRLVEHIRRHKYLEWKWDTISLVAPDGTSSPVNDETAAKLRGEMNEEAKFHELYRLRSKIFMLESSTLAQKVLSTTSVELPTLPSRKVLIKREVASRRNKASESIQISNFAADLEIIEEIRQGCSSSHPDSTIKNVAEAIEDFARYENIIQAVIAHNRSRISVPVNSDDGIQEKANRILEHLKDRIKALIKILDEHDKE